MRLPNRTLDLVKKPQKDALASPDPQVSRTVSEMLRRIEREGLAAVRHYSRELDQWDPPTFEVTREQVDEAGASLTPELRSAIEFAIEQVGGFAARQRETLANFEAETLPGVFLGQRQIPIDSVGSYAPAGRLPMTACAFMTVLVPKVAGVPRVVACTPPRPGVGIHKPTLYALARSGADAIFALGGVQAVAAMALGIDGIDGIGPADMLCGPGNVYVAEAKRQLYGRVGIDMMAGPSEVAVIADDTADPVLVAADLLAQAEHGPTSPAALVTTSRALAEQVVAEIARQLSDLAAVGAADVPAAAWRDYGMVVVARDPEEAASIMDQLAPEHLEVHTDRDAWYHDRLRNYGSLFLGERATVAFSDKAIGTNHVLPTGGAARYTGGLSVARFLKTLTYQRIDADASVHLIAPAVAEIARADCMPAHEASATKRISKWAAAAPASATATP
jgi:sulfopropanediol 3-dehydrogenase